MNRFSADYSSSLPSTPDAQTPIKDRPLFGNMSNHFSTTPAGPPPSSAASFTPADPPPPSTFGSSGVSKLKFTKSPNKQAQTFRTSTQPPSSIFPPRTKNGTPAKVRDSRRLMAPNDSLSSHKHPFQQGQEPASISEEEVYEDEEEDAHDQGEGMDLSELAGTPDFRGFTNINPEPTDGPTRSSVFQRTAQSSRKPRFQASTRKQNHTPKASQLPRKGQDSVIPSIARDLMSRSEIASLHEPDRMILETEDLVLALGAGLEKSTTTEAADALISARTSDLLRLWRSQSGRTSIYNHSNGIGPGDSASPLEKAYFLSSLLLCLH